MNIGILPQGGQIMAVIPRVILNNPSTAVDGQTIVVNLGGGRKRVIATRVEGADFFSVHCINDAIECASKNGAELYL